MRVLVASDSHGDLACIDHLRGHDVDLIVFCGDLVHAHPPRHARALLEKMVGIGPPVYIVPGNVDPRRYILEVYEEVGVHGLHDQWARVDGLGLVGFGGAYKAGRRDDQDRFHVDHVELERSLRENYEHVRDMDYQMVVTHQPPLESVDETFAGTHAGSPGLREFIEDVGPTVVASGHIHEARGTDKIGGTIVVNPGPLSKGHAAIISLNGEVEVNLL